ncbi:WhiB family transcriptional regulator, redox-sensing transcriptional regulator [Haloechinothrix alba]|uniref:Transcriptional regulator WhiB n=1 Tax=Haloechinothrix alba TaxID=664784 RepID=A0A238XUU0_9PSEU|nr:WhiB family transcriptional regulator [Haloechinothrix alba]SNR62460.1 WhiB family transcriptional regulator, redox-sensing transcriptional regulator [Haloechinothrix alba]
MAETARLPTPVTENWDWQRFGACRDMASEVFFSPEHERGGVRKQRTEHAKAVCRSCPVLVDCRSYALRAGERYGVWGGLDEAERKKLIDRRREAVAA